MSREPTANPKNGDATGAESAIPIETDTNTDTDTISLGSIESAGSRHMWRRSSVLVDDLESEHDGGIDTLVIVGRWDGTVTAFDGHSLERVWERIHPEPAGALVAVGGCDCEIPRTIVVGGRGQHGTISAYDRETGQERWSYRTSTDVGESTSDQLFSLPYVVALETDGASGTCYAAVRRSERDAGGRQWHSVVYAFDADGAVRWRYETDASPIALSHAVGDETTPDRLAIAYNRCPGDHDHGLVVLESASGTPIWTWDPGTEGDRRVGDVSLDGSRVALASHGDKRGYLLGPGGKEQWRVDLATELEADGETLYAYPTHAHLGEGTVAFVTGNTYALERRETTTRHPNEHRLLALDREGKRRWDVDLGGFAHELESSGSLLLTPCAQNFRVRDAETHALRWVDRSSGACELDRFDGIATAAGGSHDGKLLAAIEEPVTYHDEGERRGSYSLHVVRLS